MKNWIHVDCCVSSDLWEVLKEPSNQEKKKNMWNLCYSQSLYNLQFEAEPEALFWKKIVISIHSFFCQIHCRVLKLNVSCCSIGTVTDADNGNNSFHQMVIFWGGHPKLHIILRRTSDQKSRLPFMTCNGLVKEPKSNLTIAFLVVLEQKRASPSGSEKLVFGLDHKKKTGSTQQQCKNENRWYCDRKF